MSEERARTHLAKYGLEDRIKMFDVSSATVELAAKALGCKPERIAKSLTFMVGEKPVMVVTAGDVKVDNAKYKAQFGTKAKMLTPEQAAELIGHAVGGVCPFGINAGVEVYLDESLKRFDKVFPAAGTGNSAVELTVDEFEKCSECIGWVDVSKPRE